VTRRAVDSLAPGGVCALAGIAVSNAEATLNLNQLRLGQTVRGSLFGGSVPVLFIPRLIKLYQLGRLPVDRLVTEYRLDDLNQAADDFLSGAAVKPVLIMP
jgi:aryl-alcohol dehydrogenase